MKSQTKLLFVIVLMVLLLPIVGLGVLILTFSSMTFLVPLILILYVSLGILLTIKLMEIEKHKKLFYRLMIIAIAITLIIAIPGFYHKLIPVVEPTDVNLYEYSPFSEDSKVVTLDQPASLKLEGNLPIIDGATAFYPMYAAFVQAVYPEKEYDVYYSEVMSNRTGQAYESLINGEVDLIFVLAPSENQLAAAEKAGIELKLTPIGKESFVFFVHSNNPVQNLTSEQLREIYSGEITNWKDVGGKNQSIRAFQRDEDSGSQTALQHFMGDTPIMDPPVEDIATLMGTMVDVVSDYKNYKNSLGYTFRYYSTTMVDNNRIRLLNIDGVEPNVDTIRSGEYPLTYEFYAVTAGREHPHIDDFIDWILSEQGQEIIEKTGYVPINSTK